MSNNITAKQNAGNGESYQDQSQVTVQEVPRFVVELEPRGYMVVLYLRGYAVPVGEPFGSMQTAKAAAVAYQNEYENCPQCAKGTPVDHFGSRYCQSGALAAGGTHSHCTCDGACW